MKELLQQYAGYTLWAHQKLAPVISSLSEEQLHRQINSSFSSIYLTMLHLWDAESMWYQRVKLQEIVIRPSDGFTGIFAELNQKMIAQSQQWKDWVDNATEAALQHEFIYQNTKKERFKQPVYQTLLHIANHATYHRGQLITILRQVGVQQVPATDFILYSRTKK
jgi:uncharacterized damage-inducible protein DinB